MLLAFGLRAALTIERATFDPQFIPSAGFDQETYVAQARGLLQGTWPDAPYYFHPAPAYVFALLLSLVGDSVGGLYLAVSALDSLTCGALMGAGWLLTRRVWGGMMAGLLYALYPAAIIYGASLLIVPLATGILAWLVLLMLWQRERLTWWRTLGLGIFAGLLMISRLNLVPIVALYGLWLLLLRVGWRSGIAHGVVYGLIALGVVAPFTLHNWRASGGDFIPVATTGPLELYMGNNRDSNGQHGGSRALETVDVPYMDALVRDIQVAPGRFAGLLLYKFARFWHHGEQPSNLDIDELRAQAAVLRHNPLGYWWLVIPALLGLSVLWHRDRSAAILLGLMLAWLCASYMLTFAYSRFRHPAIVMLVLLAASWWVVALQWGAGVLRAIILRNQQQPVTRLWGASFKPWSRRYALPLAFVIGLLGFSLWVLEPVPKLPPKPHYASLPPDAQPLGVIFDETIELVGWRPVAAWPASHDGWLLHGQAYTVELFWRLRRPTDEQYFFSLAYLQDGVRYAGLDHAVGGISFPFVTTDFWAVDGILRGEIVSAFFDETVPPTRSGSVVIGVYYWDSEGRIVNVSGDAPTLQTLAVYERAAQPHPLPSDALTFDDQIALLEYVLPPRASAGTSLRLDMRWQALHNITADYTLFVHVLDESGAIASQLDAPPQPQLATANWQPYQPHDASYALPVPAVSGTYAVYAGLYTAAGRLSVGDSDRVWLGMLVVE